MLFGQKEKYYEYIVICCECRWAEKVTATSYEDALEQTKQNHNMHNGHTTEFLVTIVPKNTKYY